MIGEPLFFWGANRPNGEFSNFYRCNTVIDGTVWPTIEHYFQAQKTLNPELRERIRLASTPSCAKAMGHKLFLRPDWERTKYDVMLKGLRAKFSQSHLKEILLGTGDRPIYEGSPFDYVWGTGRLMDFGPGTNLLGKALMQVRDELKTGDLQS